ncbi:MAG TPA: bifunctional hydroxymethylpyrimidine kinase/phosphomethylpyrimidine kinase [Firmicutes bacterium]|jgi:hydroxymethylpyrimidine/phosphomethylpyrimidine kinase|nr:bifunctional hydroxymethylpyrimidine kinase/phosphomethylpyrimidine kinase [Bacillota bacterium]
MRKVLTIAGSDSGAGAGIQADLKTIAAHGCYGLTAITALTAQNSRGVQGVHAVPAGFVGQQIDSVCQDMGADAVKTGMLANAAIIMAVAAKARQYRWPHLVVDPVMVATSGDLLLEQDAVAALRDELLPLATVATPNIPEAEVLAEMSIRTESDRQRAAERIHALGPTWVLIKGGHAGQEAIDLLYGGREMQTFTAPRIDTIHLHGTGCTLSAALACQLALGQPVQAAVAKAKEYLTTALQHAYQVGGGPGSPNHFYRWHKRGDFDA